MDATSTGLTNTRLLCSPLTRQEAHIAEREEAWSKVEKLAIQNPHFQQLARPEVITAKMVFPRLEPMETVPERQPLPQMLRDPVMTIPPEQRERRLESSAGRGVERVGGGGEEGVERVGGGGEEGGGVGVSGGDGGEEGGGEAMIHNVGEGEEVELDVQVDDVRGREGNSIPRLLPLACYY